MGIGDGGHGAVDGCGAGEFRRSQQGAFDVDVSVHETGNDKAIESFLAGLDTDDAFAFQINLAGKNPPPVEIDDIAFDAVHRRERLAGSPGVMRR